MTAHIATHRRASWLDGLRKLYCRLTTWDADRRRRKCGKPTESDIDRTLEDSFPASDPPSYTGIT